MANKGKRVEAVAYIRTSSAANVGADKDSDKRQRAAIDAYAKRGGFDLVAEFKNNAAQDRGHIWASLKVKKRLTCVAAHPILYLMPRLTRLSPSRSMTPAAIATVTARAACGY